jgi:hypothetical protein
VTDHRKHHDFADKEGDPHSPHEPGLGALRGLWHAAAGWLSSTVGQADRRRYGVDLLKDRGMRVIDAAEMPNIAASLMLPLGSGCRWPSAWAFSVRCCPRSARISPSSSSTPEGAGPDVDMRHPVRSVVEAGAARSFGWAWRFGRAASPYGPLDDSGGGEHRPPATLPG